MISIIEIRASNKIKVKYSDDIAVVVCYGSYITGSAYQKSDLDFFFIPKTNKGYEMNMQFIIDDIGYDFWSFHGRLVCFASCNL